MKTAVRLSAHERRRRRRQARKGCAQGHHQVSHTTRPNRTSCYESVMQEAEARRTAVIEQAKLIRAQLPVLLEQLSQIPDPRNALMVQHALSTLMVYGILMFVLQSGSRRKSNETLSAPAMKDLLMAVFPELQSMPHHDTLWRLLKRIDPQGIEAAQGAVVNSLIRNKKFCDFQIEHHYLIVVDGTQKLVRRLPADTPWLQRHVGTEVNKKVQYYVYVLEANLVLSNGISIPLMSEFLDYSPADGERETGLRTACIPASGQAVEGGLSSPAHLAMSGRVVCQRPGDEPLPSVQLALADRASRRDPALPVAGVRRAEALPQR